MHTLGRRSIPQPRGEVENPIVNMDELLDNINSIKISNLSNMDGDPVINDLHTRDEDDWTRSVKTLFKDKKINQIYTF